ncbi:MAG: hypothetical protein JSS91_09780 [Bacteroidetes bacterium]|nr:hypothetical protein [Bacteroidota bacterium]
MIARKTRDVKFIIYQSLYIFVIAVLALKGANLDLTEVVSKPKTIEEIAAQKLDSLKRIIDSLSKFNSIVDIKTDTVITKDLLSELSLKRNQERPLQPPVTSVDLGSDKKKEETVETKPDKEIKPTKKFPPPFKAPKLIQNAPNTLRNPTSTHTLNVYGDGAFIISIPPGQQRTFTLGNQKRISFKYVE